MATPAQIVAAIDEAIHALVVSGDQEVEADTGNGKRRYTALDLDQLRKLRAEYSKIAAAASGGRRNRTRLVRFSGIPR